VRFRLFDEPLIQAGRNQTLGLMREQLSVLAVTRDPEERAASMEVLVSCPLPLIRLMAGLADEQDAERRELIEVQTRRYYQKRDLRDVRCSDRDGRRIVTGNFEEAGKRVLVVAGEASTAEPADLAAALAALREEVSASTSGVADVYVQSGVGAPPVVQDIGTRIDDALAAVPFPDGLWRVTVSIPTASMHVPASSRTGSCVTCTR
jgi:hypothetical protein